MRADVLVLEVGSTITKATAFRAEGGALVRAGQALAATSLATGDVCAGVDEAVADLGRRGIRTAGAEVFVTSSAAGGLRMTVHGLTTGMTARAAREAALNAGGIVEFVTAGPLGGDDVDRIRRAAPNLVILAGGVDHGERDIVVANARHLAGLGGRIPIIFAGNIAARAEVHRVLSVAGAAVSVADNIFPDVDVLALEPVRRIVQEEFNRHIVTAPGLSGLAARTSHPVVPTPSAVLRAAEIFADVAGDCLVVDVGGATTDVHSVTEGTVYWAGRGAEPYPRTRRTVDGDLGVFVNAPAVATLAGGDLPDRLGELAPFATADGQRDTVARLRSVAVDTAVRRHAAVVTDVIGPGGGRRSVRGGTDLTAVRWVLGTGGALTRVPGGAATLRGICRGAGANLLPEPDATALLDAEYRLSALGVVAQADAEAVRETLRRWAVGHCGR
ncbi:glutamate mutase L [Micromonospora sp. NPDC048843]|uniref:glutamate mutase L n=1 Tax=Micromonospora sp. NPDC048843 TaxID=3155389 RepID=UPI0033FB7201